MFDKRHAMGGAVINLTLTQGHAPKFAKASETTAFTIRFDAVTPRSQRELAIFRTAEIVGSDYELNQHTPMMKGGVEGGGRNFEGGVENPPIDDRGGRGGT